MSRPIIFGEIPDIREGYWFEGRKEMMPSSFHRNWGSGIDGNGKDGVSAIVLSGGYEDDFDSGQEILYTGAGGNDPNTRKQIEDQTWENRGNAGLLKSMNEGLPVRVIRGHNHKSEFSPKTGYTYGGLYSVVDAWVEIGKSGYKICRFLLKKNDSNNEEIALSKDVELDYSLKNTSRKETTILRLIRDTKIAHDLKKLYNFHCQVCGVTISTKNGCYAEGAHIKPLGKPHNGDDNIDNLLCLCPNHHVMFDKGCFSILDNLTLIGCEEGLLNINPKHKLNILNLKYHRSTHGYN